MGKRYLIDSNILIEFVGKLLPETASSVLTAIIDSDFNTSFINKIEVLGHHSADDAWVNFIKQASIITADDEIIEQTIQIRRNNKIKLPDAIIAATAIVNDLTLLTRNSEDFKNISDLKMENPWSWNEH
ncbi:MAG: type II toxin-antitoxin system VapC family toxin [Bacteroidetes bacterium]|nr:type II toxin-antitoxin system VapC family toxin [Bacteroidota bacterium]